VSIIWKIGTFGFCMAFAAFRLGCAPSQGATIHLLILSMILVITGVLFWRAVFTLHRALLRSTAPLIDDKGRRIYP
jgi:hypothetical protein